MLEAMAKSVSTLRVLTGWQKVPEVLKLVKRELTDGEYDKIVIFAVHKIVVEQLREGFKKLKEHPVHIWGNTPPAVRDHRVKRFQNDPSCRIFIGNIQAAGTAITLTAAHQVLFVEQSWTPGDNIQAAMRCHRIGQTRPVLVRTVGLENSIDARVTDLLRRKSGMLCRMFNEKRNEQFNIDHDKGVSLKDEVNEKQKGAEGDIFS
jgi:SWI/SNF-related matrix-associated actin-dependent regulator 1 of chromatin subfamily A